MQNSTLVIQDVAYWTWGNGGHTFLRNPAGVMVPEVVPPVEKGLLNNPQPMLVMRADAPLEPTSRHTGFEEKVHTLARTQRQRRLDIPATQFKNVYYFMRRIQHNEIVLDDEEVREMREAWLAYRELAETTLDTVPLIISEIAFYNEDMNYLFAINLYAELKTGDSWKLVLGEKA